MRNIGILSLSATLVACGGQGFLGLGAKSDTPAQTQQGTADASQQQTVTSSAASISNLDALIAAVNLKSYQAAGYRGQNTTVAILDNGYTGINDSLGVTIPANVSIMQPEAGSMGNTVHGTKMAEIVYELATGKKNYDPNVAGPTLKLYITSGAYVNLEKAVNDVISYKQANPSRTVIALYAQIWEFGGNGDGTGYIDQLIDKAITAGVIWVNAVGNLGKSTYYAKVVRLGDSYIQLPENNNRSIGFSIAESGTPVTIVLGWSDFANSYYYYQTNQDLDLILEDASGNVLGKSDLAQDGADHGTTTGYSKYAREMLTATLQKGNYRLQVRTKNTTLDSGLMFWLTVDGPGVTMNQSNGYNKVFMPADNANAIVVGAYDVNYCNAQLAASGTSFFKPDILTASAISFDDGMTVDGSSTASAVAAGTLAVYASAQTNAKLLRSDIVAQIASGKIAVNIPGVSSIYGSSLPSTNVKLPPVLMLP